MATLTIKTPLPAQAKFWASSARHRAFVGGIGSGKTLAGCIEVMRQPAGSYGTIIAPSYPMLRDATQLTFFEWLSPFVHQHNKSDGVTTLVNGTQIFWRSGDNPESLRGPNLNWFWLDEADYMDEDVWKIMLGRIRRSPTSAWITTSPNGDANWVYNSIARKVKEGHPDYAMVTARTKDNTHLPKEYIATLEDTYTSEYAKQELDGEFIGALGCIMRRDWLQRSILPDTDIKYIVGVDLAISMKDKSDDRAIVVVGKSAKTYYVADVIVGKWSFNETKRKIIETANNWNAVKVCVENVAFQDAMVQELRSETMHVIEGVNPRGRNKFTRFLPIAGKYEHGYIKHSHDLNPLFNDQLLSFDGSPNKRDDMVDAMIYAVTGHETRTYVYDI